MWLCDAEFASWFVTRFACVQSVAAVLAIVASVGATSALRKRKQRQSAREEELRKLVQAAASAGEPCDACVDGSRQDTCEAQAHTAAMHEGATAIDVSDGELCWAHGGAETIQDKAGVASAQGQVSNCAAAPQRHESLPVPQVRRFSSESPQSQPALSALSCDVDSAVVHQQALSPVRTRAADPAAAESLKAGQQRSASGSGYDSDELAQPQTPAADTPEHSFLHEHASSSGTLSAHAPAALECSGQGLSAATSPPQPMSPAPMSPSTQRASAQLQGSAPDTPLSGASDKENALNALREWLQRGARHGNVQQAPQHGASLPAARALSCSALNELLQQAELYDVAERPDAHGAGDNVSECSDDSMVAVDATGKSSPALRVQCSWLMSRKGVGTAQAGDGGAPRRVRSHNDLSPRALALQLMPTREGTRAPSHAVSVADSVDSRALLVETSEVEERESVCSDDSISFCSFPSTMRAQ